MSQLPRRLSDLVRPQAHHEHLTGTLGADSTCRQNSRSHAGFAPEDMVTSLLTLSDVMGTGWFAAVAANVRAGMTVAVVGDGAVGLLGVL